MDRLTDTTGQLFACGNSLCALEPKQMCTDCKYQHEANKRLAAYEDAEEQGQFSKLSRIAEILVLNGGYGVTCEYCINNPCDTQVSGLVCLNGVISYLKKELEEQEKSEAALTKAE